jgi:hypothetical protein
MEPTGLIFSAEIVNADGLLEITSGDLLQIFMQRDERSGTEKLFTKAS